MSSTTAELTNYVRFLRNAAPQEFEQFCAAFALYTRKVGDELVFSTGDLALTQGRAQQCVKILQLLEEVKRG